MMSFLKLFLVTISLSSISYAQDDIAGTPERLEREYKTAFWSKNQANPRKIIVQLQRQLTKATSENRLHLPSFTGQSYSIDQTFQGFIFKDIYLDTKDLNVLQSRSSYRLRYRWNRISSFARHQIFPFLKPFYPTRCEIQFKRDYKVDPVSKKISVYESRFEFRNEAEPFIFEENAPPPPWPEDEYLKVAQSGRFKNFTLLPTSLLREKINQSHPVLSPVLTVTTARFRSHVNLLQNPWGIGPNPEQVFIVTLDVSTWQKTGQGKAPLQLIELEIEADRNTSTMIDKLSQSSAQDALAEEARKRSLLARSYLHKDQSKINKILKTLIHQLLGETPLSTNFKYARMLEADQT